MDSWNKTSSLTYGGQIMNPGYPAEGFISFKNISPTLLPAFHVLFGVNSDILFGARNGFVALILWECVSTPIL